MYQKKNLLFSCVNDTTEFENNWTGEYINYEIFVNYTGDKTNLSWTNKVAGYSQTKDWDFNVLNDLYKEKIIDLEKYEYVAIINNNIIMDKYDIGACFDFMKRHDLYFGCPSFKNSKYNKILNEILIQNKNCKMRYSNFIDTRVCFIKNNILIEFLDTYDNQLYEYGFEYLLLKNYFMIENKIAIIDLIYCINPDRENNEEDILVLTEEKKEKFEKMVDNNLVSLYETKIYRCIENQKTYNTIEETIDNHTTISKYNNYNTNKKLTKSTNLKKNYITTAKKLTNKKLTNKKETNKKPTNKKPTNKKPTNKKPTNKKETNKKETNKKPTNKRKTTKRKTTKRKTTKRKTTKKETAKRKTTKRKTTKKETTKKETTKRKTTKRKTTKKETTKRKTTKKETTKRKTTKKETTKRKTTKRKTTKRKTAKKNTSDKQNNKVENLKIIAKVNNNPIIKIVKW